MNSYERVMAAIRHQPTDRVPKGELWIAGSLANRLMGTKYPEDYQHFDRDLAIRKFLGMDLINVGDWPQWPIGTDERGRTIYRSNYGYDFVQENSKHIVRPALEDIEDAEQYRKPDITKVAPTIIRRFAQETDLFVFAQIGGPVSMLDEMFPMEDYMVYSITNPDELAIISDKVIEYEIEKAKLFLDAGAHGILMADDIAFNTGLLLPPKTMEKIVYPYYEKIVKEIKAYKDVPVFMHSDGDLNAVMDKIVELGFDGLQSLQPAAHMDIAQIKQQYGDKLCLWGNIDLNEVMCFASPEEVKRVVRNTMNAASREGGFILSTCNVMIDCIPNENVLAMMEASEQ
ncbi:MAG: uroporphyrinogen decarboxylase family protein [Faecousia sp.]